MLKQKKPLVAEVIKLSGLKRPTAYQALKKLKNIGLVITDSKKYGQKVSPAPVSKLIQLVGVQQRQARKLEIKLGEQSKEIQKLFRAGFSAPQVERFEGPSKYRELANMTLASQSKVLKFMGNVEDYLNVLGQDFDRQEYLPARLEKGLKLRVITNESKYIEKISPLDKKELRERKIIPKNKLELDSSLILFDDTVIFFSKPEEQLALKITSNSISSLIKKLFDDIWERY